MMINPRSVHSMLLGARHFSGYYRKVSDVSAQLQEHQKKFEADPNSVDNAFHYFRVRQYSDNPVGAEQERKVPDGRETIR